MIEKIKKNLSAFLPAALIVMLISGLLIAKQFDKRDVDDKELQTKKTVKAVALKSLTKSDQLEFDGTVKPANKVDVVALVNGTIRSLNFKVGDKVSMNQSLASLSDDGLATNYANASLNYSNIAQNAALTKSLTDENVRQSGLGVLRAQEVLDQAQISLDTAKQNLANAKALQEKSKEDMKSNALVSFNNYLNSANGFLDQVNFIIKAEGASQLDGISDTLSVKNLSVLDKAKENYLSARAIYNSLLSANYESAQAENAIGAAVNLLSQTKATIDSTILVLDNTISSSRLSDAALNVQRTSFASFRANNVASLNAAQASLQSLQNIDLINKKELDMLSAAVKNAENQLKQAKIGLDNSKLALNNTKQGQSQQILLSKSSLDNARGQVSLIGTQLSDLNVRAPIAGVITAKLADLGAEVRVGQKIGEISQTNMIKVVVGVSPDDADLIKIGQKAVVGGKFAGTVSSVNPSADPASKKVGIEIVLENKGKLVAETLVKVLFSIKDNPSAKEQYKVPLASLTVAQNEGYVYVAGENQAKKIGVELLEIDGDWALIKMSLPAETKLIVDGNKNLNDGDQIELK